MIIAADQCLIKRSNCLSNSLTLCGDIFSLKCFFFHLFLHPLIFSLPKFFSSFFNRIKSEIVAITTELSSKSVKNAFKAINIGSYQEVFPSFYPLPMMDRTGLDTMTDTSGLCLQDLVGSNNNTNNNNNNSNNPTTNGSLSSTSQSNSNDHLHNHHHHHHHMDGGAAVSVSSAISNLMSPSVGSGLTSGLSHLHHSTHPDLSGHHHHHHITSPHTPSVLHEPLEKLKCES